MARMYGKIKFKYFNSCRRGCCTVDFDKATVKRAEESLAFSEADEEINFTDIKRHIGAGGYCCLACRDEYTGVLGTPEDLEGIEGVTFGESR